MRHVLAATLALLLLCPGISAHNVHNWANVSKLKRGTPVWIVLHSGGNVTGRINSVTDSAVEIMIRDRDPYEPPRIDTIDRTAVHSVMRMRGPRYVPDARRWMIVGAVAGGTAGIVSGAISDANSRNQGQWLVRGFAGSLAGASLGLVSAVVVLLAQTPGAFLRRNKLIFEANGPPGTLTRAQADP